MTGRSYRLASDDVTVVTAFCLPSKRRPLPAAPPWLVWHTQPKGGPRNVAIARPDGSRTVRPFRGLRRLTEGDDRG
jgi:hypothetical protein